MVEFQFQYPTFSKQVLQIPPSVLILIQVLSPSTRVTAVDRSDPANFCLMDFRRTESLLVWRDSLRPLAFCGFDPRGFTGSRCSNL